MENNQNNIVEPAQVPVQQKSSWKAIPGKLNNKLNDFSARHCFSPIKVKLGIVIIFVLIILLGFLGLRQPTTVSSKVSALGLKNLGELATQAGYFTSVQQIQQSRSVFGVEIPLTQGNYVYSYDGKIKAGLDFDKIDVETNEITKVITVTLPEVKLLSVEIDENSFKLYNDGKNLFTSLNMEDVNASMISLKESVKESAISNGILENARTNAETLIQAFLSGYYDLTEYTIEFK